MTLVVAMALDWYLDRRKLVEDVRDERQKVRSSKLRTNFENSIGSS